MQRIVFVCILTFWVVMNALLWNAEFGAGKEVRSKVPIALLWDKILTAPDSSTLELRHRNTKIGYVRWIPNVGSEQSTGAAARLSEEPEGQITALSGYSLDIEGSLNQGETTNRLRFGVHLEFKTNRVWQSIRARLQSHGDQWIIQADDHSDKIQIEFASKEGSWQNQFSMSELRNPSGLLSTTGMGLGLGLLGPGLVNSLTGGGTNRVLMHWEGTNDLLPIRRAKVRVYRLETQLLGSASITVLISRVGELLRIELPEGFTLVNEAIAHF